MLATLSPRVGGEADTCSASSAADFIDEGARGHGFRAGLVGGIFPSSTLFFCVGDAVVLKMQASRHSVASEFSQVFGSMPVDCMLAFRLSL